MSKVIRLDEKVSVWQRIELTFPDDVDIVDTTRIREAIKEDKFIDISYVDTYRETEEHIQYDFDNMEYL